MKHENPLIPMGAITGKPSKKFLTETMESFRAKGITQYLIYPRSGCELAYMSDEWFDMCGHILSECERLGYTSVWLYDEFNWPSGTCGGRIPEEHPEFALRQYCVRMENGVPRSVIRTNPTKTDLLNPAAVDAFIAMTHEVYAAHFSRFFGTLVKGIFSDEPGIGYLNYDNREDLVRIPYYDSLEEDYRKCAGNSLFDDILSGIRIGSEFWREKVNRLLAERFRTCFAERISAWCERHHLLLTGHLMAESDSWGAHWYNGHPLPVLDAFSCPGMDEIFTRMKPESIEWLTFGTVMHAAERKGNRGALAELFALGPCDLTPSQVRRQIWLAALFGVDKFVMAVAALDARGNLEKNGYFNPFGRTQGWFELYDSLGEEASAAAEVALRERECRVALRYPYRPVPIQDLLRRLSLRQYNVELLLPGEESGAEVVLDLQADRTVLEERSGTRYSTFHELESALESGKNLRTARVALPDGSLAENVFIRCFRDRSAVVLDFSGTTRELFLERSGTRTPFRLPAEGVVRFPAWTVEADCPNTFRPRFQADGTMVFTAAEPLGGLVFALRNYGPVPELLLDGTPVSAGDSCSVLPQGFREIYRQSAAFSLSSGTHVLKLRSLEQMESPYFPPVFLCGAFSRTENVLSPARGDGAERNGTVGSLTQRGTADIPCDALFVSVDTEGVGCSLKIGGRDFGRRLWAPFTWRIPPELCGKRAEAELTRYFSCGGMFGPHPTSFGEADWKLPEFEPDNRRPPKPFCDLIWS